MQQENSTYDNQTLSDQGKVTNWQPKNKAERRARRLVYDRFNFLRSAPLRKEAEEDWDAAETMFRQYIPTPDPDDWRAHLVLPDAFAAIQAQMQETIERKSRPYLKPVEHSDKPQATFKNAVISYNMDKTSFDYQRFLAKYNAAIKGTSFSVERYRVDKRKIQDLTGVNEDGTIKYTEKEIVDFDDTYTEWMPNEFIYIDDMAKDIDEARDMVERQLMDIDEFHRVYDFKPDFMNVDKVRQGGDTSTNSFFKLQDDVEGHMVEVIHYYNRARDEYYVVANNILVRLGPIPFKHKELPVAIDYHYRVPGKLYGMGIPKVIKALSEERAAIRNLRLDRQKMSINKMFLVNDQYDLDEDELVTRPHGLIEINTNGGSIRDAVSPLEYGDIPASAYKEEETLLEDIRRAHGIDDRIQGNNVGGTATEAAILKETAQKRINMIATLAEMDTIKRIGRLKWSNIQFFYPAPKVERLFENDDTVETKSYRRITIDGQEFKTVKDDNSGKYKLIVNDIDGASSFKLDKSMAKYLEGEIDVTVDADSAQVLSRALQQAKVTEMFTAITAVPSMIGQLDSKKALRRYLEVNQESPEDWMRGDGKSDEKLEELAELENQAMKQGLVLGPTEGANEVHTKQHLIFTQTAEYQQLPEAVQQIFLAHITGEHDANPATGSTMDAMQALPPDQGGGLGGPGGGPGMPAIQNLPQIQPADLTPSTVTGEQPNSSTNTNQTL
jgi:hypothetical protein